MKRFLAVGKSGNKLFLQSSEIHHIKDVLKISTGTLISVIFQNKEFVCKVSQDTFTGQKTVEVIKLLPPAEKTFPKITCLMSIQKKHNFHNTLAMLTELGIKKICIFTSQRSIPRNIRPVINKKIERWKQIINCAIKQSGQTETPTIDYFSDVNKILSSLNKNQIAVLCNEQLSEINTSKIFSQLQSITWTKEHEIIFIIGPEGGFTQSETKTFKDLGCFEWRFAPTILRCCTASVVAFSLLTWVTKKWK